MEKTAIGIIELNSISRGLSVVDHMIKRAQVKILEASTICPGKYMIILSGGVAEVEESLFEGKKRSTPYIVDDLFLPYADKQILPALLGVNELPKNESIGVFETFSVSSTILAADASCKTSDIKLIEIRVARGMSGKGFYVFTGKLYEIETAVKAGKEAIGHLGTYLNSEIIPAPHPEFLEKLC